MSFDPRPRPHTVHLAFSDPDITDTYRDDHSSNAASSPRVRHPTGDTPLSRRTAATSPGRWSLSRRSASDAAEDRGQDADLRELSNLDKLLDLLDGHDDDEHGHEQTWDTAHRNLALSRSIGMSTPPPAPSTSRRPPPATSTIRKHASSAPRPHPSASSSRSAVYPINDDFLIPETIASPVAPPSTRSLRPPLSGRAPSAVELLQRANGFSAPRSSTLDRAGLPDSPSPRPGSVAALRRSEADRSGASALDASLLRGGERAYGDEAGERTGAAVDGSYEETVASVDSITRVAEAALKEFDTIVSHHSSPGRPASRMRDIPSPPHSATASTFADHAARPPSSSAPPPQPQRQRPQDEPDAQDVNLQLVQELRSAQDYITYLQHELHAITDVVQQLREKPEPSPHVLEQYESAPQLRRAGPQLSDREQVEQTAQAAFEVVKHTLAMLPSLPSSSLPSPGDPSSSSGPALLSLHRALAFTRSVDQLAHRTRDPRRDEDVFAEENLCRVLGVVDEWAARDEARGGL
ncbi:hypothetical protein JCM9279_005725 [Rhodotorula babjevae]